MTKHTKDETEKPKEGSDKVKSASDRKDDNLKADRTVDTKVIENDRAKAAEDFSVTNINVGEVQNANAALKNSGSAFVLYDGASGETIAKSKKAKSTDLTRPENSSNQESTEQSKPNSLLEENNSKKSQKNKDIYDSATISTKAVEDQQMSFYKKALEQTTDPEVREQLKQQATMLDKMANPQKTSDVASGTTETHDKMAHLQPTSEVTFGSASTESVREYNDLYTKSIRLGDAKPGHSDGHTPKHFPFTTQKDSLTRVTHVVNQNGDYDYQYAKDARGNDTTFLSKVSVHEKSGNSHVYEKRADGWHIDGAKRVADINNIDVDFETGKLTISYKNHSHRIDYPDGKVERIFPNSTGVKWPDGSMSIRDVIGTHFTRTPDGHGGYVDKHSGPRPDDTFNITKAPDGHLEIREKPGDKPYQQLNDPHVNAERDRLNKLAHENISNTEELSRFQANMARFENREHKMESDLIKQGKTPREAAKLAHEEIANTYSQISRLLEAGDKRGVPVTEFRRTMIAEQLMRNAANPTLIDQGCFNTCNVATVEVRTFSKHPSAGAKLVVDMATNNEFDLSFGRKVKINPEAFDNFTADDINPPEDGTRSLASQIFQVTAVNIKYALEPIPHMHYDQLEPKGGRPPDNGERLSSNLPFQEKGDSPQLNSSDIVQIAEQITHDQPKEAYLTCESNFFKNFDSVTDEASLRSKLKYAKDHGLMPITIGVHTGNEPFYTDSGAGTAGGSGGWHVVNVMDYHDGAPPSITLDNQWGSKVDHTGKNRLSLDDLYFSMRSPDNKTQIAELEKRRASGTLSVRQELDLDRHKFQTGQIKENDYAKCVEKHLLKASKDLTDKKLDYNEYRKFINQFNSKIHDFGPEERITLVQFENDQGMIEYSDYKRLLTKTAIQLHVELDAATAKKAPSLDEGKRYRKAMDTFVRLLNKMPPDDQLEIKTTVSNIVKRMRERA